MEKKKWRMENKLCLLKSELKLILLTCNMHVKLIFPEMNYMSLNTIYLQLQSQIKYIANRNIFHIHIEFHKIQLKLIKYDRYLCTKAR